MRRFTLLPLALAMVFTVLATSCSGSGSDEAEDSVFEIKKEKAHYGLIKHVDVSPEIDKGMAKAGFEVFDMKCTACHKYEERYVGPALGDVTDRREPEFVMNMILDTENMIDNDDTVKCLLQEYLMRMPNQNVDEKDARNVLEHLREYAEEN